MKRIIQSGIGSLHTVAESCPRLTKFSLHAPKTVEVEYNNGSAYILSAEYLRVYSPAVDSKIRSIGVEKVISGRRHVGIMSAEPVGNYGVRLLFDDLHKTGIFTWDYFYHLGSCYKYMVIHIQKEPRVRVGYDNVHGGVYHIKYSKKPEAWSLSVSATYNRRTI